MLLALTLVSSCAEVFSIGAVLPLLGVLSSPEQVFAHEVAKPLIQAMGISTARELLLPVTMIFCAATLGAAAARALVIWLRTRLTFAIATDLSTEIFFRTLHQSYDVHLSRNSSEVIDAISSKVNEVIFGVVNPMVAIASNGLMLAAILLVLLLHQPLITMVGFGGFGLIYLAIYKLSQARLKVNSQDMAECSTQRIKTLQESLGGIRDVLLDHSQAVHCATYKRADSIMRRAQSDNSTTYELPRYAVEALGMCLIALLAFSLERQSNGFQVALPVIGGLAVAAQRLLPLIQQIYHAFASLSGNDQSLHDTLSFLEQPLPERATRAKGPPMPFAHNIECQQLGFRYRAEGPWVLHDLNLTIPKGARIGFIGNTGSGKSTLLDILMGLLQPSAGLLLVDGQIVTEANSLSWQSRITHVPQAVYLSDASFAENIAFGVQRELIDMVRVRKAAAQAQIDETIQQMVLGYQTMIGERGVRLSGGQRQRVGIARALYRQADVLVFDEATSALDTETEQAVMQAIDNLHGDLTVLIVAHRLTTLKSCDFIVELASGTISRSGDFQTIVTTSV